MAELTLDSLKAKLKLLQTQRQQLSDNVCAVDGAIYLCNQLIADAEAPSVPPVKAPDGDHA